MSPAGHGAVMDALLAGRIGEQLRAAAIGEGPCIFVHVPKTAGTSLRAELAQRLQPDANIEVDYADTSRSFHDRMDDAVDAFLARAAATGVRFASGHILGRHVGRIAAELPGARFVTMLRDPVRRVVSDYRHQCSPRHPGHEAFRARVPSIDAYVELHPEREKAAQHLIAPEVLRSRDPTRCVEYLVSRYAFVGVQEHYPTCFRVITALLGRPAWPTLRENVNAEGETDHALPPELAARIRAANPIDCALHDAVLPRWQAVGDAVARHLA